VSFKAFLISKIFHDKLPINENLRRKGYFCHVKLIIAKLKSKRYKVIAKLSVEVEFIAMTQGIYELMWLKVILENQKIK